MKLKIGNITQKLDVNTGETYQEVPFTIWAQQEDGSESFMNEVIQQFPLSTTPEEIKIALEAALEVYKQDYARFESLKVQTANLENAQKVSEELSQMVIE